MPYIQVNDRRFALRVGQTRIGAGPDVEIRIAAALGAAAQPGPTAVADATVDLSPENTAAIRRAAPEAQVRVNGVQLGAEPTPLIHGDKIEILGADLYFGDDRKGGSTQFISAGSIPELQRLRPPGAAAATGRATGGRVISLVDGREYTVGVTGLAFGRDAACDVVIPSSEVSRRHAEIQLGDDGYVVTDTSTNGLFVNGDRVEGSRLLRRGDVIRMGNEDFRFYADVPARAVPPPPAAVPPATPKPLGSPTPQPAMAPSPAAIDGIPVLEASAPPPAASAAPSARAGAALSAPETPLADVGQRRPAPLPPSAAAPAPRAVATLTVLNAGPMRGHAYAVTSILAHVGRGGHNEVVIPEESVSDSHATLQRRDGVWYVTDLGSRNGTYVNGRPIQGEQQIGQSGELRVGGVKLGFAAALGEPLTAPRGGTRAIAGAGAPEISGRAPDAVEGAISVAACRGRQADAPAPGLHEPVDRGGTAWLWAVALLLIAAAGYILFKSW